MTTVTGPIFLTGFMATGKSRIGRLLAELLDWPFMDTDEMIVASAKKNIPEIFSTEGEAAFREREHACVVAACGRTRAVVALGGGAITHEANREAIRAGGGTLVCLQADVETILERVSRKDNRPLLAGLDRQQKREKIERMLADRAPHYAAADVTFHSSDHRDAREAAARLLAQLEKRPCTV